jgi:hypothetical protein
MVRLSDDQLLYSFKLIQESKKCCKVLKFRTMKKEEFSSMYCTVLRFNYLCTYDLYGPVHNVFWAPNGTRQSA